MPSALDLRRARGVPELLALAAGVWWRNRAVFLALAAVIVAPAIVFVDGVWGGALADPEAQRRPANIASEILFTFVVPPLVTAVHVAAVLDLARDAPPSIRRSLRFAATRAVPLITATALYTVLVLAGFIAFIIPGLWVSVACYFAAQVVACDPDAGPADGIARSFALVRGAWWRAFVVLASVGVTAWVGSGAVAYAVASLGTAIGGVPGGVVLVAAHVGLYTVAYSVSALAGTLLFFDLRARKGQARATDSRVRERA